MTGRAEQDTDGDTATRSKEGSHDAVIGSGDVTKLSDAGTEMETGTGEAIADENEPGRRGRIGPRAEDALRDPGELSDEAEDEAAAHRPGREHEAPLGAAGGTSAGAAAGDAFGGTRVDGGDGDHTAEDASPAPEGGPA